MMKLFLKIPDQYASDEPKIDHPQWRPIGLMSKTLIAEHRRLLT